MVQFIILLLIVLGLFLFFLVFRCYYMPINRLVDFIKSVSNKEFPQFIMHKSCFKMREIEDEVEKMSNKLKSTFDDLSSQNSKIMAVLSSMSDGVLFVSKDGIALSANPVVCKILGVIEEDIVGKTVREVVLNNEITELIYKSLSTGSQIKNEIDVISPFEGTFDLTISPVFGKDSEVLGVVSVFHDVTDVR